MSTEAIRFFEVAIIGTAIGLLMAIGVALLLMKNFDRIIKWLG